MTRASRRIVATLLLLLSPALKAAPAGAVCAHGAGYADAATPHDLQAAAGHAEAAGGHGSAPAPAHGDLAAAGTAGHGDHAPADDCPMDSGRSDCSMQLSMPGAHQPMPEGPAHPVAYDVISAGAPPATAPPEVFRPPRR
jgi:hypothetical protein